jgi:hypothetical protein
MLAMWPSVYPAETLLDFFTYAGSPATYSLNLGAGAGLWWQKNGFSISANYVSANGGVGNPATGGIGTTGSAGTFTSQFGYAGSNWGAAFAYTYGQNTGVPTATSTLTNALGIVNGLGGRTSSNNLALSAYWQPSKSGWIPSISAGWGIGTFNALTPSGGSLFGVQATAASWSVGLQWADAFVKGNALGMAFGQQPFVTQWTNIPLGGGLGLACTGGRNTCAGNDGNWAWDWWYKFQVTDNISVTPGLFYLSKPMGQQTPGTGTNGSSQGYFNSFGYLIKTTFKF